MQQRPFYKGGDRPFKHYFLCRDSVKWKLDEPLFLPGIGKLIAEQKQGEGIRSDLIGDENMVEIRFRQGGEIIKPANKKCTRKLKKWLQDWKIPPWERERIPLIYINDELAQVLLGPDNSIIASKFSARPDETSWKLKLDWQDKVATTTKVEV